VIVAMRPECWVGMEFRGGLARGRGTPILRSEFPPQGKHGISKLLAMGDGGGLRSSVANVWHLYGDALRGSSTGCRPRRLLCLGRFLRLLVSMFDGLLGRLNSQVPNLPLPLQ
jgi:hypothetical protein